MIKKPKKFTISVVFTNLKKAGWFNPPPPHHLRDKGKYHPIRSKVKSTTSSFMHPKLAPLLHRLENDITLKI